MGRARKVPDEVVFEAVLTLLDTRGEKAVTFAAIAERAGLAASSLAERHGTVTAMIADSREAAWQRLEVLTDRASLEAGRDAKGAVQFLKYLNGAALPAARVQPERAARWRARVEAEIALRLGGGAKGRDAAAMLFAVWYAQTAWPGPEVSRLRLKGVLRRLGLA
ncbi:hypothetical protein [Falsigemmobacter faecalis]|uniref:TetR family transcriptional regulator n=1 Tax=Falsigemmobacter faecalis TaxID=2488730 RepID=A0A3P3D7A0_9RHOB|nr:hypothetical protein [Falsigemmobacter faecalis]RRH70227.1 hypothetical protein EG244_17195 [Falsigemmobacter faecalis]